MRDQIVYDGELCLVSSKKRFQKKILFIKTVYFVTAAENYGNPEEFLELKFLVLRIIVMRKRFFFS